MTNTCKTCRFWQPNLNDEKPITGECHANPPQIVTDAGGDGPSAVRHTVWPPTWHFEWCGKHEPKPTDTEGNGQ